MKINWFYRDPAEEILLKIAAHFKKKNPKKFKKTKNITFVGVHHRRGDHLLYQSERGLTTLDVGYFLEAMDMYREKYKRVVFVYVSDDIEWAKNKLGNKLQMISIFWWNLIFSEKRIKTKDFYIAGALLDPDMACKVMILE